jgi:3-hydroxy acid dehydrogenase/malonic semialdehyde reductase
MFPMTDGSRQTVVLTGAAGGMGRAITKALIESGRRVVLVDRDASALQELAATAGAAAFPIQLDVSDAQSVDRLPDSIPEHFRPIDVLINNAGHDIGGRKRFDLGSADDWSNIIQTNLIGLMRVTRAIVPDMVRRNAGHIVNISSINAVRIVPDMAAYSTSKAGVHMFTETLRGLTRTSIILTRYRGDRQKEQEYFDQFKMALEPADIARSIVFALDQPAHVQIAEMMILPVNRY